MSQINPIPLEIKSPTRIYKGLYVVDFAFVIIFWSFMSTFEDFVNPKVNIFYQIFNVLLAFYIVRPSLTNIGRKKIISIIYSITKDKRVYHTDHSYSWKEGGEKNEKREEAKRIIA